MDGTWDSWDEIERLRAVHESMRDIIDQSLDHLREMYLFLGSLEPARLRPAVYVDDHPVCCEVPMWLTKLSLSVVSCNEYTCQVCGRATAVMH